MRSKLMIPRYERLTDEQTALAPVNQKVDNANPLNNNLYPIRVQRKSVLRLAIVASMH